MGYIKWGEVGISEDYLRDIIIGWYTRSQGSKVKFTPFDSFVSLWISFNAWGTHKSRKETDRTMVEWAKEDYTLKETFNTLLKDSDFFHALKQLKGMCPIPRHRKYKGSKEAIINDVREWEQVLEVIYVIRCNLFHGRKSLRNEPDRQLVNLAYKILSKVFAGVVRHLKVSETF